MLGIIPLPRSAKEFYYVILMLSVGILVMSMLNDSSQKKTREKRNKMIATLSIPIILFSIYLIIGAQSKKSRFSFG